MFVVSLKWSECSCNLVLYLYWQVNIMADAKGIKQTKHESRKPIDTSLAVAPHTVSVKGSEGGRPIRWEAQHFQFAIFDDQYSWFSAFSGLGENSPAFFLEAEYGLSIGRHDIAPPGSGRLIAMHGFELAGGVAGEAYGTGILEVTHLVYPGVLAMNAVAEFSWVNRAGEICSVNIAITSQ